MFSIRFSFGHHVLDPHYHPDALLEVVVSTELHNEPGHPLHLMGADVVALRHAVERQLYDTIAGRMIIWDQELEHSRAMATVVPEGLVAPQLAETVWPLRPTIEALTLLTALLADQSLDGLGDRNARLEEVRFHETPRTAGILLGGEMDDAIRAARQLFAARPPADTTTPDSCC